jgi:hypothetical protein
MTLPVILLRPARAEYDVASYAAWAAILVFRTSTSLQAAPAA